MSFFPRRRYYNSGRTRNFGNYGGYRNYSYNYWRKSSGTTDARTFGRYTHHDVTVLRADSVDGNVQIITWMDSRPICFVHGGIYYFGRDAIAMLENQAQYMLPKVPSGDNTRDSFSFGIVPHPFSDKATTATSVEQACVLTYNFIVSNVMPIVALNDPVRIADMFTVIRETEDHRRDSINRFEEFCEIFKGVYADIRSNPFNPEMNNLIQAVIQRLIDSDFITVIDWTPDYRYRLRGWMAPIEPYILQQQQQQQEAAPAQQPQQPRSAMGYQQASFAYPEEMRRESSQNSFLDGD